MAAARPARAHGNVVVSFSYPVAVDGPIVKLIDNYAAEFSSAHPGITIVPRSEGSYQAALSRVLAAHREGSPPTLSVLLSSDLFTLIDEDAIVPFDARLTSDSDRAWIESFFPAFMLNSQTEWRTWGIPFQRSMILLFWNKTAFAESGLDPDRPPASWADHLAVAETLTRRDAEGRTSRWGTQIPTRDFGYWMLQALAYQAGAVLANRDGTRTAFDAPGAVEALTYLVDLSRNHRVMAPGSIDWATTPADFLAGRTAMMWTSTGNLTTIRSKAGFPFGVSGLPAYRRRGSPTGGGNFYLSSKASPAEQEAAVQFVRWMTQPERAAEWSVETGYVAVSPAAYETSLMTDYIRRFPPGAVARSQLRFGAAEFSTHENLRVTRLLEDAIEAALEARASPMEALKDAQAAADAILKRYR